MFRINLIDMEEITKEYRNFWLKQQEELKIKEDEVLLMIFNIFINKIKEYGWTSKKTHLSNSDYSNKSFKLNIKKKDLLVTIKIDLKPDFDSGYFGEIKFCVPNKINSNIDLFLTPIPNNKWLYWNFITQEKNIDYHLTQFNKII